VNEAVRDFLDRGDADGFLAKFQQGVFGAGRSRQKDNRRHPAWSVAW